MRIFLFLPSDFLLQIKAFFDRAKHIGHPILPNFPHVSTPISTFPNTNDRQYYRAQITKLQLRNEWGNKWRSSFDGRKQSCLHFRRVKGTGPTTRWSVRVRSPCSRNQKSKQSTSKSILLINVKTGSWQADVRFPVIKPGESSVTLKPGHERSQRRKPASYRGGEAERA